MCGNRARGPRPYPAADRFPRPQRPYPAADRFPRPRTPIAEPKFTKKRQLTTPSFRFPLRAGGTDYTNHRAKVHKKQQLMPPLVYYTNRRTRVHKKTAVDDPLLQVPPARRGNREGLVPLATRGDLRPRTVPLAKRGEPTEGGDCELWRHSRYGSVLDSASSQTAPRRGWARLTAALSAVCCLRQDPRPHSWSPC